MVPEKYRLILELNPMTGLIEGFRASFFGKPFDWFSIGISAALTAAILFGAAYSFRSMERSFADMI